MRCAGMAHSHQLLGSAPWLIYMPCITHIINLCQIIKMSLLCFIYEME